MRSASKEPRIETALIQILEDEPSVEEQLKDAVREACKLVMSGPSESETDPATESGEESEKRMKRVRSAAESAVENADEETKEKVKEAVKEALTPEQIQKL